MLTLARLVISGLRLLRLFMHRLVRFAVSDGYGNAISCDCPDVLRSANFRHGEPGKPQLIVRRAQAPPVPSFRITHCLAGLVRSVILFYPFIYLDFNGVLRISAATTSPGSMHRHSSEPFRWCDDDTFCCTTA